MAKSLATVVDEASALKIAHSQWSEISLSVLSPGKYIILENFHTVNSSFGPAGMDCKHSQLVSKANSAFAGSTLG